MAVELRPGADLAGFRIDTLIARGGMGVVYSATQLSLGRRVALKVVASDLASLAEFRTRFLREVQLVASLDHPNVLPVYEAGDEDGVLYLAMRLVEGESLAELLGREGALEPARAVAIVSEVAEALAAAHRAGLVHRDVKPANVLLTSTGAREHAYLCDFGVARRVESTTSLTRTGGFVGSIAYAAPEQIQGAAVDARTDVYALGCLLFECLVGEPPFPREHEAAVLYAHLREAPPRPSARRPELADVFDAVCERALAKDTDERFRSVAELASALAGHTPLPSLRPHEASLSADLPSPASSFVGRDRELRDVISRIEGGARLVTLTGPGGTGKTRLALAAATSLVGDFEGGASWVGLASLRDPSLVTETIARSLGAQNGLADHLRDRELLLLLDNLEQVIDAAPELGSLLGACPNLTLLVTSRELLRISGEVEYAVPPLAVSEAVALFCERARLEPAEEIGELCARLELLPLAVELAAARTRALTVSQIAERLSQRLDLLKGDRDADPRQQTLRATIEWSYELLSPEEQQLFARLSVFAGGCTLEAAEEVADADLDTIQSLVEKSLLRFTNGRYWMLETVREFAGELQELETQRRYVDHFVGLVSPLVGDHASTTADAAIMERLEVETANLRAVLRWLIDQRDGARSLEVVAGLVPYWLARGDYNEGLRWVDGAVTLEGAEDGLLRSRALSGATDLSWALGDLARARAYATESVEHAERIGEPRAMAQALHDLAEVVTEERDFEGAKKLYDEAIRRAAEVDYPAPGSRLNLGLIAFAEGDYERSRELTLLAMGIFSERSNSLGCATALHNLACVALYSGEVDEARSSLRESIGLCVALRYVALSASCLLVCAAMLARTNRPREAVPLLGAHEKLLDEMGSQLEATEQQMYDETLASIRAALDDGEIAAEWLVGRELALDQALSLALGSLD